ncbi:hypothetical protein PUN28_006740 [Cardiocondyla obscurior]|uniref:Secreted protein n=1 Tax=Cardiocondyla obscurior TaxID=286306 RepID=A0AAW2G169_9HYME
MCVCVFVCVHKFLFHFINQSGRRTDFREGSKWSPYKIVTKCSVIRRRPDWPNNVEFSFALASYSFFKRQYTIFLPDERRMIKLISKLLQIFC